MLELDPNPLIAPAVLPVVGGVKLAEREMLARPHIKDPRRTARQHKADVRDGRQAKSAADALGELPDAEGAVHVLITGRFSLWDCVPAILDQAGPVDVLRIATLGFSKRNVEAMAAAVDAGTIGRIRLLCSHYFKGTSPDIYRFAAETLGKRKDRVEFLSVRTHAKLLLLQTPGRVFTLESSANLRSCKNLEQLTVFGSPTVHEFHRAWIDELFEKGAKFVNCYTGATARPREGEPGAQVGSRRAN